MEKLWLKSTLSIVFNLYVNAKSNRALFNPSKLSIFINKIYYWQSTWTRQPLSVYVNCSASEHVHFDASNRAARIIMMVETCKISWGKWGEKKLPENRKRPTASLAVVSIHVISYCFLNFFSWPYKRALGLIFFGKGVHKAKKFENSCSVSQYKDSWSEITAKVREFHYKPSWGLDMVERVFSKLHPRLCFH